MSPIYWPEYVLDTHASRFRRLLAKLRKQTALISKIAATSLERDNRFLFYAGRYAKLARVFSMVDILVPNSISEGLAIRNDLDVTTKTVVVPLGVDQQTFYDEGIARSKRTVLYVGRIEPHKNQLGLINAIRKTDMRLVLVGRLHPDHNEYCQRVLSNCVGNVKYAGYGDATFLRSQYNSASVHVLPSWSETVGLTSLEAASCGAKIVHTKNGFGVEYFGDSVLYCDPSSSKSIFSTIVKTIESEDLLLKQYQCVSKYSWDNSISKLVKAYSEI
jgi:glycosyltransferase involved in cell wall biosynthesis